MRFSSVKCRLFRSNCVEFEFSENDYLSLAVGNYLGHCKNCLVLQPLTQIILSYGFSMYLNQFQKPALKGFKKKVEFCKNADNFHAWIVHWKERERERQKGKFPAFIMTYLAEWLFQDS